MFGFQEKTFSPSDINIPMLRAYEREHLGLNPDPQGYLERLASTGFSWSIFKGGLHISSGGVVPDFPHVGALWQLPSMLVETTWFTYSKYFRAKVDEILNEGSFKRLWTVCPDDELHNRWMQFLGFQKEGVLRKLGLNDENYCFYARLK